MQPTEYQTKIDKLIEKAELVKKAKEDLEEIRAGLEKKIHNIIETWELINNNGGE